MKANVLVMPELYLTGYGMGEKISAAAMTPDDPALDAVAAIARDNAIALMVGYPERAGDGLFNSAALWDKNGRVLLRYAKTHLFGRTEKGLFRHGERLMSASLEGVVTAPLICYDAEFPEPARLLAEAGVHLILTPAANMAPYVNAPRTMVPARAAENRLTLVYANYAGNESGMAYTGQSAIIGPNGQDLARAGDAPDVTLFAALPDIVPQPSRQLRDRYPVAVA